MIMQERNPEMVDILRTDFQHRNEPNFAWKSAVSSVLAIPNLIAAWPMSVVRLDSATDRARDVSGAAYHLTDTNGVLFGYDNLVPYADFTGTNENLSRIDGGAADWADVRGNEGHIPAALRGLSLGGWFRTDTIAAGAAGLISKWESGTNDRSWLLRRDGADIEFRISVNGIAGLGPATVTGISAATWYYIAARYEPDGAAATLTTWVNSDTGTAAIGAAATIFDSDATFRIGAYNGSSNVFDGKGSLCWLSACALSDAIMFNLFQQQRAMFGV